MGVLKRSLSRSLLVLMAVVASVGVAEMLINVLEPIPHHRAARWPYTNQYIRYERGRNVHLTTGGRVEGSRPRHFTTNDHGFRGDALEVPKPAGEFRIFMVGGSTTECFDVDDEDEIAAVVQQELAARAAPGRTVKAYNAGVGSAASDDHVAMIGQRIVHLEPDMIVVFAGINDLCMRSIPGFDYLHYTWPRSALDEVERRARPSWWMRQVDKLRIGRLVRTKLHAASRRELVEQSGYNWRLRRDLRLQQENPPVDDAPRTDPTSYGNNLRSIIGMAAAHRARLVFITQQTTWNSSVDPGASETHWMCYRVIVHEPWETEFKTFREDLMDEALEALNHVMRALAEEHSIPVYDLAEEMPKSRKYFYDDCHFNPNGSRTAGRGLAAFLVENDLVPLDAHEATER